MYCPVHVMSPFSTLKMNGIQRSKELPVYPLSYNL